MQQSTEPLTEQVKYKVIFIDQPFTAQISLIEDVLNKNFQNLTKGKKKDLYIGKEVIPAILKDVKKVINQQTEESRTICGIYFSELKTLCSALKEHSVFFKEMEKKTGKKIWEKIGNLVWNYIKIVLSLAIYLG